MSEAPTGEAGQSGGGAAGAERTVRVRVFVEGWVQGVSFRYASCLEAARLGITGWVRNLPDGRVEAVYEGPRDAVEEMLAWTRRGPQWAHVRGLSIHDEDPQGEQGFGIR
ncbi:MAG: acylphosphatase [Thermoleophilia bacterium]|nr:acylphosphatase [Thermoleophilia bacterium]